MNKLKINRRDFLKLAFRTGMVSFISGKNSSANYNNPRFMLVGNKHGTSIYREPDEKAPLCTLANIMRLSPYMTKSSVQRTSFNPIWYKCWGGYVFSGDLYEVKYAYNELRQPKYATGQLAEVTVPYTRSMFYSRDKGWEPLWLLLQIHTLGG